MITGLKLLQEELIRLERAIKLKRAIIKLPVKILKEKEVISLKKSLRDFTTKFDKLKENYEEEKEKRPSLNKSSRASLDTETEGLIAVIHHHLLSVRSQFDKLYSSFYILEAEQESHPLMKKLNDLSQFSEEKSEHSGSSSSSLSVEADKLLIDKVFMNTIFTTSDVIVLQEKETVAEERIFMGEVMKLNELFPISQSKRLIVLDFLMNVYKFSLEVSFTIQQISTVLSIFYFIFIYAFISSNVTQEKVQTIFEEILTFHSVNRPPFSYEIFTSEEKDKISNFAKMVFFNHFMIFENIFRYEVSICFFADEPRQIPNKNLPDIEKDYMLKEEYINNKEDMPVQLKKIIKSSISPTLKSSLLKRKSLKLKEKISSQQIKLKETKENLDESEKSPEEIEEEEALERLQNFISSFNKLAKDFDGRGLSKNMDKNHEENGGLEAAEAKIFLDQKVPEIKKEICEQVEGVTKKVIRPVEMEMEEREKAKSGKK